MGNPVEVIVIFLQLCGAADIIFHIVLHDSPRDFILYYFVVPIKEPKLVSSEEDTAHQRRQGVNGSRLKNVVTATSA